MGKVFSDPVLQLFLEDWKFCGLSDVDGQLIPLVAGSPSEAGLGK